MSTDDTKHRILTAEEAKALREAATPGPWLADTPVHGAVFTPDEAYVASCGLTEGDTALIAAAPDLAATVEHLSGKLATAEAWLKAEADDVDYVRKLREQCRKKQHRVQTVMEMQEHTERHNARLCEIVDAAEGRMEREHWKWSDKEWEYIGPGSHETLLVLVRHGFWHKRSTDFKPLWQPPYWRRITLGKQAEGRARGIPPVTDTDCGTVLEAIEAAEAWLREEGLIE